MGRTACTEPQCLYKGVIYLYITYVFNTSLLLFSLWMLFDYNKTSFVRQCAILYEQILYESFMF